MRYLALMLALLLLVGCGEQLPEPTQTVAPTQATAEPLPMAPDFTVYDAQGNAYALSDFRGKPVVLNFWASWCNPCRREMPVIDEAYKQYADKIHFVLVNLTDGEAETVASASSFVARNGYSFPVYYDTSGMAAATYGVYSIPCTYFIDARGVAITMASGSLDAATLQRGIDMIME